jgi:hypothetical protein
VPVEDVPESAFFAGFVSLEDDPEPDDDVFWSAPEDFSAGAEESADEPFGTLSLDPLPAETRLSFR